MNSVKTGQHCWRAWTAINPAELVNPDDDLF